MSSPSKASLIARCIAIALGFLGVLSGLPWMWVGDDFEDEE